MIQGRPRRKPGRDAITVAALLILAVKAFPASCPDSFSLKAGRRSKDSALAAAVCEGSEVSTDLDHYAACAAMASGEDGWCGWAGSLRCPRVDKEENAAGCAFDVESARFSYALITGRGSADEPCRKIFPRDFCAALIARRLDRACALWRASGQADGLRACSEKLNAFFGLSDCRNVRPIDEVFCRDMAAFRAAHESGDVRSCGSSSLCRAMMGDGRSCRPIEADIGRRLCAERGRGNVFLSR